MSNKNNSNVWKFFAIDDDKTATCSLCQKKKKKRISLSRVSQFYFIFINSMFHILYKENMPRVLFEKALRM